MKPINTSVPCRTVGSHNRVTFLDRFNGRFEPFLVWKVSCKNYEYFAVTNLLGKGSVDIEEIDLGRIKYNDGALVRMKKNHTPVSLIKTVSEGNGVVLLWKVHGNEDKYGYFVSTDAYGKPYGRVFNYFELENY